MSIACINFELLIKFSRQDGTAAFEPFHAKDIAEKLLSPALRVGVLDLSSKSVLEDTKNMEGKSKAFVTERPPLSAMFNLFDFEVNIGMISGFAFCWQAVTFNSFLIPGCRTPSSETRSLGILLVWC
jgi:hypothetical protein